MGIANHNAIVVGGGPGGSTAATLLAKAGARVLLVEKEKFPRYQIGESLLPATIHGVCRLLGVSDDLHAAGFIKKRGGTFRWGKHPTPWTFDFGSAEVNQILEFNFAYQVERAKFDELLLNNARRQGVEVREETSVTDVIQEGVRCSGVTLLDRSGRSTEARATFIIDASGNQSRLHALAGKRVFSKFFQNLALVGYSACFVDPIFSSGVHLATYSGMLAARSIATILKRGMPEAVGLDIYERRYRLEYSVFYDFLVSFYDMHQDEQSYFWKARKVLCSDQAANHAFLQLVAGAGTTVAEFLRLRERSGELFQLRVDGTVDPNKRSGLLRELMKERDMAQVHLRAVGRSAQMGRQDGLDAPLDFNPGGDPATNDGYRVSPDGLCWERLAESG